MLLSAARSLPSPPHMHTYMHTRTQTMVYLVDSQSRNIQVVLEPDNFSRDVPLLAAAVLAACTRKRRQLAQQAIRANDIPALKRILAYHTLAEAVLQDVHFCPHGTPLHFVVQHPASLPCLPHLVDRDALMASPDARGLLPVHAAVAANRLDVVQRLVEVAGWAPEQGGAWVSPDLLVNLRTLPPDPPPSSSTEDTDSDATPPAATDRTPLHLSRDEEVREAGRGQGRGGEDSS
jgi:hypothetical protein